MGRITRELLRASSLFCAVLAGPLMVSAAENGARSYDWSGVYVGATAGYGWGEYDQYLTRQSGHFGVNTNGFVGGATLGYNYQIDPVVLGLEADFQGSGIRGSRATTLGSWTCSDERCRDGVDWFGTLRGRVGVAYESYLPFVTGGVAYAHVKSHDGDSSIAAVSVLDRNVFGYVLGGGVEKAFSKHITAKAEALYVDLNDATGYSRNGNRATTDNDFTIVRMGVNWKF